MVNEIEEAKHPETLGLRATMEALKASAAGWESALNDTARQLEGRIDQLAADNLQQADQLAQRDTIITAKDEKIVDAEARVKQRDDVILTLQSQKDAALADRAALTDTVAALTTARDDLVKQNDDLQAEIERLKGEKAAARV